MNIIEVEHLVRTFGSLRAVDDISFEVKEGEIFGFLGPNGAGKTTTINILCTLLRPTAGRARVRGHDVVKEPAQVRRAIGLVFQDPSLDERLTAWENLLFHAVLYGVPADVREKRMKEVLQMVGLYKRRHEVINTFSGGMKRRLEIARGLVHYPHVLFLDEPTLGLDPQTRRYIWDYIMRLREKEGVTVFFTTHYMDEAEHADRIAIIDHGKIVALDTPERLKSLVGGDVITIKTQDDEAALPLLKRELGMEIRRCTDGQGLYLEVKEGAKFIPYLVARSPVPILSVNLRRPTLDDVFLKLTGRQIREEAEGKDKMRARIRVRARRL